MRQSKHEGVTDEERRALLMLAASPTGCRESLMFARAFQRALITGLIKHKLATAGSKPTKAGGQLIDVTQIRITAAGHVALPR